MFEFHKLNARGIAKVEGIASGFKQLVEILTNPFYEIEIPEGRELAIVKTKLEEACFFAKKALAIQLENQAR